MEEQAPVKKKFPWYDTNLNLDRENILYPLIAITPSPTLSYGGSTSKDRI